MKILCLQSAIYICCFCTSNFFSLTSSSSSSILFSPIPYVFFFALSFTKIQSSCLASSQICVLSFMFCSISLSFWFCLGSNFYNLKWGYSYSYYSSSTLLFDQKPCSGMNQFEGLGLTPSSSSRLTCSLRSITSTSSQSLFICYNYICMRNISSSQNSYSHKTSAAQNRDERHQPIQRYKLEQTRTLLLEQTATLLQDPQRTFTDLSIKIGTSIPDEVETQGMSVFVRYPSVQAAISVVEYLKGQMEIKGKKVKVQYYPVRKIDLTIAYDWYCQKCDYKNFGRRGKCYRCQSQKTADCKLSYSTQPSARPFRQQSAQNCSLMLRGPVLCDIEESLLLELFESIAPVKDVRQIKNKLTGRYKDFAFIQFFTPEQTSIAYREANDPGFRIAGQKVTVLYSRNKSDDEYFKPLPYQAGKRQRKAKERPQQQDNYYHRQRQRQIEEEKARPSITMQQLKQKHEQEMKKNQNAPKQMNSEQTQRRKAQQLARQWERQMKSQATMYVCPVCVRKFHNLEQMRQHEKHSQFHAFNMAKLDKSALSI